MNQHPFQVGQVWWNKKWNKIFTVEKLYGTFIVTKVEGSSTPIEGPIFSPDYDKNKENIVLATNLFRLLYT